jgi:dynein heavy chain
LAQTADHILATVSKLRSSGGAVEGQGGSARQVLESLAERVAKPFAMAAVTDKAQPLLKGPTAPYVVVALQECASMNALLVEISRSLDELRKGLNGQLNMTSAMDDLGKALSLNQVPGRDPFSKASWEVFAYPSRKSLGHWFDDLEVRVRQLSAWEEKFEKPTVVHLSSLFNPTAFLTAVTQIVAREKQLPLDSMTAKGRV